MICFFKEKTTQNIKIYQVLIWLLDRPSLNKKSIFKGTVMQMQKFNGIFVLI